jgi:hypothetical protein
MMMVMTILGHTEGRKQNCMYTKSMDNLIYSTNGHALYTIENLEAKHMHIRYKIIHQLCQKKTAQINIEGGEKRAKCSPKS